MDIIDKLKKHDQKINKTVEELIRLKKERWEILKETGFFVDDEEERIRATFQVKEVKGSGD